MTPNDIQSMPLSQIQAMNSVKRDTDLALDVYNRYAKAIEDFISFDVTLYAKSWTNKEYVYNEARKEFISAGLDRMPLREQLGIIGIRLSANGVRHSHYNKDRSVMNRYHLQREYGMETFSMHKPDYDEFLNYMVKSHIQEFIMTLYDV